MKTKMYKFRNQHISKLTNLLIMMLISSSIFAQAPQKMSYQAVVRDGSNNLVNSSAVGMRILILQGSQFGAAVYVETQTPTTNTNGLLSIEIGTGTVVSGNFTTIDWSNGPYFIKTETDPTGGTSYTITGTSQLLSVPYALSAGNVTGLEKITEGSTTGWRLIGRDPATYGNIGNNATDLSLSGGVSTTNGATGNFSLATGFGTTASGFASTAMGNNTSATGGSSTAMGFNTVASGDVSTAMGSNSSAFSYYSVALGRYNVAGGNQTTWVATDPLFEIGNGAGASNLSNALTVLKNGNTDVSGVLRASGKTWPTTGAGVEIAYDTTKDNGFIDGTGEGYIQSFNRNTMSWKRLTLGASSVVPVSDGTTNLGVSGLRWSNIFATNGTIQTSDRRMKKDIKDLNYGLNTVLQLRPVSYKWKKGNQDVNLGLIAQEVQKLIPEMVDVGTDENKTLGLKYSELIPVLIKAVQEQQKIIENQQNLMASQEEVTASQQTEIDELKGLVSKLLKKNNLLVKN